MNMTSRVVLASPAAVLLVAASAAGPAGADPAPTQVITTVAVGPGGNPINGYREAPPLGNVSTVNDCTSPSPSAVADNVYFCSPSAADAGTCWPSTGRSLLCMENPWDMRLHRVSYDAALPPVQPLAAPNPFAVVLDDGTRCLLRNGGAWGGRADGFVGAYGCGDPHANLAVLCVPSQPAGTCPDRSSPSWTVKVGQLGEPGAALPPPQTHTVTTAWMAGGRAGQ